MYMPTHKPVKKRANSCEINLCLLQERYILRKFNFKIYQIKIYSFKKVEEVEYSTGSEKPPYISWCRYFIIFTCVYGWGGSEHKNETANKQKSRAPIF